MTKRLSHPNFAQLRSFLSFLPTTSSPLLSKMCFLQLARWHEANESQLPRVHRLQRGQENCLKPLVSIVAWTWWYSSFVLHIKWNFTLVATWVVNITALQLEFVRFAYAASQNSKMASVAVLERSVKPCVATLEILNSPLCHLFC